METMTPGQKSAGQNTSEGAPSPGLLVPGSLGPLVPWSLGLLALLGPGYLWVRLINNLRLEWSTNPQYGYGWVVPVLCAGLFVRRWKMGDGRWKGEPAKQKAESREQEHISAFSFQRFSFLRGPWSVVLFAAAFAFLYLPTRLVEGATPEWRPIQWALGVEAVGLTLCAAYLLGGWAWLKQAAFPVCFFFVAIPWPTLFEIPLIQGLGRLNASLVVEVLGVLGVPAVQHGNVLEVGTGLVGIDDACSGIRSLQSSVMVCLFLGEFYWLSRWRRLLLVPTGFVLAIAFNVCRTSFLTLVAAKKGVGAIARYHDEAGVSILLACMAGMWLVAMLLRKPASRQQQEDGGDKAESRNQKAETDCSVPLRTPISAFSFQRFSFSPRPPWSVVRGLALGLVVWLVLVEAGVQAWYHLREAHTAPGPAWSVALPETNPTYKDLPITEKTRYLLRFDEGREGQWAEPDGSAWAAFYFSWNPGRVAGYLAKRHTPDVCMPAAGQTLQSGPDLMVVKVHEVELPMRSYVFDRGGSPLYVYQCRWEAGEGSDTYVAQESARFNLVRGIWAGRGIHGQKVLEVILSGYSDAASAREALVKGLQKMIAVTQRESRKLKAESRKLKAERGSTAKS